MILLLVFFSGMALRMYHNAFHARIAGRNGLKHRDDACESPKQQHVYQQQPP